MNSVGLLPSERTTNDHFAVTGDRALYLFHTHELKAGANVRAFEVGGKSGTAYVLESSAERVVLATELNTDPPPRNPISLIVAVPRPQTVKKVLSAGAQFGVTNIHFVHTSGVVKSYLQSKSLLPAGIDDEILKGLEQTGDSNPPVVTIHRSFSNFVKNTLSTKVISSQLPLCIVADSRADKSLANDSLANSNAQVFIALGPEIGWADEELAALEDLGFQRRSLGTRILRVETALVSLIGQIHLLREQARA